MNHIDAKMKEISNLLIKSDFFMLSSVDEIWSTQASASKTLCLISCGLRLSRTFSRPVGTINKWHKEENK